MTISVIMCLKQIIYLIYICDGHLWFFRICSNAKSFQVNNSHIASFILMVCMCKDIIHLGIINHWMFVNILVIHCWMNSGKVMKSDLPKVTLNSAIIFLPPSGLEQSTSQSIVRRATIALIHHSGLKGSEKWNITC